MNDQISEKKNHRLNQHLDAARTLAPVIAEIRSRGWVSVEEIRARLNDQGISPPFGKRFTTGSTHRLLKRIAELQLGPALRSVSRALSDRFDWRQMVGAEIARRIDQRRQEKNVQTAGGRPAG